MVAGLFLSILGVELDRLAHRSALESGGGAEDNRPGFSGPDACLQGPAMPRSVIKAGKKGGGKSNLNSADVYLSVPGL